MPSPVNSSTLLPLLPTTDKTLCERIHPGIINFMAEVSRGFAWEFKVNGEFSDEFVEMIRALDCVGGVAVDNCPVIALAGTATPGNTTLALSFNGAYMVAGYEWNLFRSTTEGVFSDPAIAAGTTAGSVVTYTDTVLTNGVEYFYKFTAQNVTDGCDLYEVQISGTPQLCATLLLSLSVVSPSASTARLTITGNLLGTYAFTLYASNLPNQIGTVVDTGVISDHSVIINGATAFQYDHATTPTGVPGGGATWYYTVQIQEDPACALYELTQNVFVNDAALDTPILSFSDLAFRWGGINGAARYSIYVRPTGTCKNSTSFAWLADTTSNVFPFTIANFPCSENFDGTYCTSKWEVKVVAFGTNGIASAYSNVVNTPDFIKFPGQCTG